MKPLQVISTGLRVLACLVLLPTLIPVHAQQKRESDMRVIVSSQDAQGVTQNSFNQDFLKAMESHIRERTRIKANEYLASIGKGNQQTIAISESTYVELGTRKLIVIRVKDEFDIGAVTIAGIVGTELKRVVCAKFTPGLPPITFGPCGQKVEEIFRVKF